MRIVNPAPLPAFRQSLAKRLIESCPAELKHYLENGGDPPSKGMSLGTVVHQLVLGGCKFEEVSADNYRTKAAQEHRDAILARGYAPLLSKELEPLRSLASNIKRTIEEFFDCKMSDLECEVEHRWNHDLGDGRLLHCLGTPDAVLRGDEDIVIDLKVGEEPNPDVWDSKVGSMCYDVQAAAYHEALGSHFGHQHYIVAAQMGGAGLVSVLPLDSAYMQIGQDRWDTACKTFAGCVETDKWPAYKARPITPPGWMLAKFLKGQL